MELIEVTRPLAKLTSSYYCFSNMSTKTLYEGLLSYLQNQFQHLIKVYHFMTSNLSPSKLRSDRFSVNELFEFPLG